MVILSAEVPAYQYKILLFRVFVRMGLLSTEMEPSSYLDAHHSLQLFGDFLIPCSNPK